MLHTVVEISFLIIYLTKKQLLIINCALIAWSFCIFCLLLHSEALEDRLFYCRWAYFIIFRVIWENIRETVMATSFQRTCNPQGEDESSWTSGSGQALADEGLYQVWLELAEWALASGTCPPPGQVPPSPNPRMHFSCLQKCW